MKFSKFVEDSTKSIAEIAEEIQVSPQTIHKYVKGERIPEPDIMQRIFTATNGQVTANDFYDLPHLSKLRKSPASRASP